MVKKQKFFKRHPALRYFAVSFGCCVLIAGTAAAFLFKFTTSSNPALAALTSGFASVTGKSSICSQAGDKDSFNMFISVLDSSGNPVQFAIIRLDQANKCITSMIIPVDLKVSLGSSKVVLSAYYAAKGINKTVSSFFSLTRISADYTMALTPDAFTAAFKSLGGINYNVPQDVKYTSPAGTVTTVDKGTENLNGKEVFALIAYSGYSGGITQRYNVQTDLLVLFIKDKLRGSYLENAEDSFSDILDKSATDFDISDITSRMDTLKAITSQSKNYVKNPDPDITQVTVNGTKMLEYGADSSSLFYKYFDAK